MASPSQTLGSVAPHLSGRSVQTLRLHLDALLEGIDPEPLLARDPLRFVRRYTDPRDQEVAGLFCSTLAFGHVAAFGPVLERIVTLFDLAGGPRAWLDDLNPSTEAGLGALGYRWIRGPHLVTLARALGAMLRRHGTLEAAFTAAHRPAHGDFGPALTTVSQELRELAQDEVGTPLPRGLQHLLPSPTGGSACKRWNLMLRWMVRKPGRGVAGLDLGAWDLPIEKLLIPLDTHVGRMALLLGLTHRTDGSWRTALEITRALRKIHPTDPIRYDFALAHLGISGACQARRVPRICDPCPLLPVCRVGTSGRIGTPRRSAGG